MTERTEEFIEHLISMSVKAYKKNERSNAWGRRIDRHEPVTIEGIDDVEFSYWRELGVYFTADYILDHIPTANVEICLDGNDSYIGVEVDDEEQALLESNLTDFFNRHNIPME